jgi:cytochrome c-type biogenesis protein CcmH
LENSVGKAALKSLMIHGVLTVVLAIPFAAWSQTPLVPAVPPDKALEARVMLIAEELRCLVCQNETIAASNAELAVDLRQQIREQLRQGRTTDDILGFMAERYGDFVLYRPPLKPITLLLWVGPFALLLLASATLVRHIRRRRVSPTDLTSADLQQAARLLGDTPPGNSP